MIRVSVEADVRKATAGLSDLARRQLPFATAQAVNALAKQVKAAEVQAMGSVFSSPTPFTLRGVSVLSARKGAPTATVFVLPKQATYLQPYETGGGQVLGARRGLPVPKGVGVNRYGNLTRRKLQQLNANPRVFQGRLKSGVSGFFQRLADDRLRLLVRWTGGVAVKQRLDFGKRAEAVVRAGFKAAFDAAIAKAVATRR